MIKKNALLAVRGERQRWAKEQEGKSPKGQQQRVLATARLKGNEPQLEED